MYLRPVSLTNWHICLHSSTEVAIGTVQITCLPASRAAMVMGPWSGIGELMWTKSTWHLNCRKCRMICNLNLGIGKHILKARVALSNIELVTDLIQLGLCPLTY